MNIMTLFRTAAAAVFSVAVLAVSPITVAEPVMDPVYVDFFGITADSGPQDPDSDNLSNDQESLLWTDPFAADTDQDGWPDGTDVNPVSRAFSPWGSPFFTQPDGSILYTWPLWMQAAWTDGGLWLTNIPYGWHSPVSETNPAALHMEVDRGGIESNLVLRIDFLDHANSSLYLDLFDTNDTLTASALYGNLLSGTGSETNRILEVPLAANPAATGFSLRKGEGNITILSSLLYVDDDLDGLDAAQEAQLSTSDFLADSDGDGMPDGWEITHGFDPLAPTDAVLDADSDGFNNFVEFIRGTSPASNMNALSTLTWDALGNNNWQSPHWLGGPPTWPDAQRDAVIGTNVITVGVPQAVNTVYLKAACELKVAAELSPYSLILSNAAANVTFTGAGYVTSENRSTTPGRFAYELYLGTISAPLKGAAASLRKGGTGNALVSGANNSYGGETRIDGGCLQMTDLTRLPAGSLLNLNGGVLATKGTLSRTIGSVSVYWNGNGGFAGYGGALIVNLNGGAAVDWGSATDGFNAKTLILNGTIGNNSISGSKSKGM